DEGTLAFTSPQFFLVRGESYILDEKKAPTHYETLPSPIEFTYDADGTITITSDSNEYLNGLPSLDDDNAFVFKIKNVNKMSFPETGGVGLIPFVSIGGVLVLAGLYAYGKKDENRK
ncbi:MAG: hypothetical protein LBM27_02390, partial [Lactobacillaceae bacterium]|nr:hypothetical protein [Lactobacillaceae bacterium]